MSKEKRTAVAKKGGAGVAAVNRSFAKDRNLAKTAGSKGGLASVAAKRARKAAK